MKRNHYLYEIKNNLNGKIYVGMRTCKCAIENDKYMGSGIKIINSISKHGVENFSKRILDIFNSREELENAERDYVNLDFISRDDTYNIAIGGHGGDTWSGQTSLELKEKHKLAVAKACSTVEFKKRASIKSIDRFKNQSERDKLSVTVKNRFKNDDVFIQKFWDGMKNRQFPESWKENVILCKQTEEYKQKRSEIATNWPTFKCPVCHKVIKSKGNYTQHMNKHNRNGEVV